MEGNRSVKTFGAKKGKEADRKKVKGKKAEEVKNAGIEPAH